MELALEYRHNLLEHNLILKGRNQEIDYYKRVMIEKNQILGLLMVKVRMLDGYALFHYKITHKASLDSEIESHKLSYFQLEALRRSLIKITVHLEEYLLDMEDLLLKPEYIFIDTKSWEVYYCYFPGLQENPLEEICNLMEYLVKKIDHQDRRAVQLGYEMYRLTSETNFSMRDLEEIRIDEEIEKEELQKNQVEYDEKEEEGENNSKRNIKSIVLIGVISIIILVVAVMLYLTYMGYQLF